MSIDIGELVARIGGDTSGLSKALSDSKSMINQASTSIGSSIKNLVSDIFSWKTAIGILAGEAGLGLLVKKGLEAADSIAKIADAVGVSTDKIQEFHHIGTVAGITIGAMDQALRYFTRNVGQLKDGTGDLITRLQETNETLLSQLKYSKSTSEALDLYFKAMARATTQTERMNLASAGFSREGMKFVNVVRGGEGALNALKEQAYKLGLVVDESLIRKSEEAYTKVRILGEVIKSKLVAAIGEAAPQISNFIDQIQNGLEKLSKWISSNKDSFDFGSMMKNGVLLFVDVLEVSLPIITKLAGILMQVAQGYGYIYGYAARTIGLHGLSTTNSKNQNIQEQIRSYQQAIIDNTTDFITGKPLTKLSESQSYQVEGLRGQIRILTSEQERYNQILQSGIDASDSANRIGDWIKKANEGYPDLIQSIHSFRAAIQTSVPANNDYVQTFKDMKAAGYDYGNNLTDSIMTFKGFKSTLNDSTDAFFDFGREFKNTHSNANELKKDLMEIMRLNEESRKLELSRTEGGVNPFIQGWSELNSEYELKKKTVIDEDALNRWYYNKLNKLKDDQLAYTWNQEIINENIYTAGINFKVKEEERYQNKLAGFLKSKLEAEKTSSEKTKELALQALDIKLPELNPLFNKSKINELVNEVQSSLSALKDIQIKVANQEYIEKLKYIEQNVFDWEEASKEIEQITNERNSKLSSIDSDFLKSQEELTKKTGKFWKDLAGNLSNPFRDAFRDILAEGKLDFDKLGKSIKGVFADVIADSTSQSFINPFMKQIVAGMQGNLMPASFMGPLAPGQALAPAWMGNYGNQIYAGAGGAIAGYAATGGMGGAIGGMAGAVVAGPIGAALGTAIGSMISDSLKSEDIKIPSYDLLWETIDGQISSVTETWKNMGKDQRIFDAAQEFVQSQIDFFKMLSTVAGGEKPVDFTFSLAGTGVDIQKILEQTKAQAMVQSAIGTSSQMSEVFGPGFNTQLKDLFVSSLSEQLGSFTFGQDKELLNKYLEWKFAQFSSMPSDQAQQAYDKWMKEQALFSPLGRPGIQANSILDLFQARNPGVKIDESIFTQLEELGQKTSKGWFTRGEIAFNNPEIQKEWQDFFTDINQQIHDLFTTVTSGMGQAFVDSLGTGEYQTFEQSFKKSILAGVQQGLIQGFADQELIPIIFKPFYGTENRPGLTESMKQYQAGEMTLDQLFGNLDIMFGDLNTTLNDFGPIWEKLNTGFQDLSSSLGINTEAVTNSTKQYSDSIDKFLADLSGGSLAPSQSMAGQMEQYNRLYMQALYDPSKSQDLLSYVGSSYLKTLQGTSEDYAGAYAGVTGQIAGLPTAWGTPSDAVMNPVNPGDYSAGNVAGQTQGIGFKQAMKEALQEVVQEKIADMLLGIKIAIESPTTTTGKVIIEGKIGTLMIEEIKSNPDVKTVVHNA